MNISGGDLSRPVFLIETKRVFWFVEGQVHGLAENRREVEDQSDVLPPFQSALKGLGRQNGEALAARSLLQGKSISNSHNTYVADLVSVQQTASIFFIELPASLS